PRQWPAGNPPRPALQCRRPLASRRDSATDLPLRTGLRRHRTGVWRDIPRLLRGALAGAGAAPPRWSDRADYRADRGAHGRTSAGALAVHAVLSLSQRSVAPAFIPCD